MHKNLQNVLWNGVVESARNILARVHEWQPWSPSLVLNIIQERDRWEGHVLQWMAGWNIMAHPSSYLSIFHFLSHTHHLLKFYICITLFQMDIIKLHITWLHKPFYNHKTNRISWYLFTGTIQGFSCTFHPHDVNQLQNVLKCRF